MAVVLVEARDPIGSFGATAVDSIDAEVGDVIVAFVDVLPTDPLTSLSSSLDGAFTAITADANQVNGARRVALWQRVVATAGTHVVTATPSNPNVTVLQLSCWRGVDNTTPAENTNEANANTTDADLSINSAAGDKAIVVGSTGDGPPTFTADGTTTVDKNAVATNATWARVTALSRDGQGGATDIGGDYSAPNMGWKWRGASLIAGSETPVLAGFLVEAEGGGEIGEQTAGVPFNIRVTALDQFAEPFTAFEGTVDITSDGSLSVGEGETASFVAGVLASHEVAFDAEDTGIAITATGDGEVGVSNNFDVVAAPEGSGAVQATTVAVGVGVGFGSSRGGSEAGEADVLTAFTVEDVAGGPVDDVIIDTPMTVRVKARNQFGAVMVGFTGTVEVSSDGSLSAGGGTSAAFVAGVLDHEVEFDAAAEDITLSVEDSATGLVLGESDAFAVVDVGQFPPLGFVISDEFIGADRSGMQEIEFIGDSIQSVGGKTRTTFPAGMVGGVSACIIFPNPETVNADEYWVRAIYKLSSDFYAHAAGTTKQIFFTIQGGNRLYLCVRGAGNGALTWGLNVQQTTNPAGAENYGTSAPAVRNQLYTVDIHVKVNTPGTPDGLIELFVDGVQQTLNPESTSVPPDEIQWTESGAVQMDTARVDPTWGGSGGETGQGGVPADFYMEFDYFGIAVPE